MEPNALIAVCGCYAVLEQEAAAALGADLIGGTEDREAFADKIEELYQQKFLIPKRFPESLYSSFLITKKTPKRFSESLYSSLLTDNITPNHKTARTRALLKIQDGCGNHCAYCIIPEARGAPRSIPLAEIEAKAKELEAQGYKEIVLTGIEISSYSDPHHGDLVEAIRTVSIAAPSTRIRLGSLDPAIMSKDVIAKMRELSNLCGHFHISLQSGCDGTLARMGRRYNTGQVSEAIAGLRGAFDNCGITADLITGFPGETDAEFEQTLAFIEKMQFSAMHIFPYSKRPGTRAADMPGQIAENIKRERAKIAADTAKQLSEQFRQAQIGRTLEVLTETRKGTHTIGHTRNYLTVAIDSKIDRNTLVNAKITEVKDGVLMGERLH